MKEFSNRNLKYMRFFAEHCPDGRIGQQSAAQLPWFHRTSGCRARNPRSLAVGGIAPRAPGFGAQSMVVSQRTRVSRLPRSDGL